MSLAESLLLLPAADASAQNTFYVSAHVVLVAMKMVILVVVDPAVTEGADLPFYFNAKIRLAQWLRALST